MNLKFYARNDTSYVDTKVYSIKLHHITLEVIGEVTGIPFTLALSTPFLDTSLPRTKLIGTIFLLAICRL